jgi:ankyrin repeat protein
LAPLIQAARAGNCEIVKILIARGAQVNVASHVRIPLNLPSS